VDNKTPQYEVFL